MRTKATPVDPIEVRFGASTSDLDPVINVLSTNRVIIYSSIVLILLLPMNFVVEVSL